MDQETDRIKQHIDSERQRLGDDLHEIEDRVKSATDWRAWFDANPGLMLGAALAGGFIVSQVVGKAGPRHKGSNASYDRDIKPKKVSRLGESSTFSQVRSVGQTVDNTFAALVGVLSGKLRDFVADAVPGFREQYDEVSTNVRSSTSHADGYENRSPRPEA